MLPSSTAIFTQQNQCIVEILLMIDFKNKKKNEEKFKLLNVSNE